MTQENKHTPAPWFCATYYQSVRSQEEPSYHVISGIPRKKGRGAVCDIYTQDAIQRKANTHLIAAAPEMLAEMEKLAQALEDTGFEPEQSFYDVIKKARGM